MMSVIFLLFRQLRISVLDNSERVTQSAAITRYAAKLAGLYPTDDHIKAMLVDELIDVANEAAAKCPQNKDPELKKKLREEWAKNDLVKYYTFLAKKVEKSPSKFVIGDSLSIADLYVYGLLKSIRSGICATHIIYIYTYHVYAYHMKHLTM